VKSISYLTVLIAMLMMFTASAHAQSFNEKVKSLKALLTKADTISAWEAWNISDDTTLVADAIDINTRIMNALVEILNSPEIAAHNIDTLLMHPFLGITHSEDRKVWVMDWYENTGGTFQSYSSIMFSLRNDGRPKFNGIYSSAQEDVSNDQRCIYGSATDVHSSFTLCSAAAWVAAPAVSI
jgi:hypothetical protein